MPYLKNLPLTLIPVTRGGKPLEMRMQRNLCPAVFLRGYVGIRCQAHEHTVLWQGGLNNLNQQRAQLQE